MSKTILWLLLSLGSVVVADREKLLRDCMCTNCADVDQSEGCRKYGEELGNELWPAVFLMLFMIGLWFFACSRRCCNCCGGLRPVAGCCCGDKKGSFDGYTGCEKSVYRSLMLTVGVSAMVIGIPALTTNDLATEGIQGLGGELDLIYHDIVGAIDTVVAEAMPLPDISASTKAEIVTNADDAKKEMEIVQDIRLEVLKYDHEEGHSRRKITIGFFCLVMGSFIFFLLIPILSCGVSAATTCIFCLLLFVSLFMFIFVLLHHALAVFTTDFCGDYGFLAQRALEEIESSIGCGSGNGGISTILNDVEEAKQKYMTRVCTDIFAPVCDPTLPVGFTCPPEPCLPGANIHSMELMLTNSASKTMGRPFQNCPSGVCSISECAIYCENVGGLQDTCRWAHNNFTIYGGALSRVEEELYPIAACTPLRTFIENLHYPLCSQLEPALNDLFRISVSQFCLLVIATWLLLMGDKRIGSHGKSTHVQSHQGKGAAAMPSHDANTNNAGVA
eukprot:TRINITY_DN8106_c0_g1_i2.p1 TRINITY_DN8106_c0_g1~~TRINITY_DN8106_c0_g1_i2.p1  ORF type:complete len:503 (+),score=67.67 TRINITY_DN8106_c0_g1_i2:61-1569(+)